MRLLEYEAKKILAASDINVPNSTVLTAHTTQVDVPVVLKSQVPIGGRGKAGGIQVVKSARELPLIIQQLYDLRIQDYVPHTILAEELLTIQHEYYLSIIIDQIKASTELMAHRQGGIEVEANDPASFLRISLSHTTSDQAGEQLAEFYDLPEQTFHLQDLVENLYTCFIKNDCTLLEINPLILMADNKLVAGDCKMELDDAAAFRHAEWTFESTVADANFVTIDPTGNVATIANGAGLAMATVDAVAAIGLTPANFLDIGGGASTESVLLAFQKIMEFSNIKAIVINIFAGITRCDQVAEAIITAREHIPTLPPLFIRLSGTGYEAAVDLLTEAGVATLPTLNECLQAARKVIHG